MYGSIGTMLEYENDAMTNTNTSEGPNHGKRCIISVRIFYPLLASNSVTALVTLPAASRTRSLSRSRTYSIIRPSNLSGWNRNMVARSLSLRSFALAAASTVTSIVEDDPGPSKNAEMASSVICSGVMWSSTERPFPYFVKVEGKSSRLTTIRIIRWRYNSFPPRGVLNLLRLVTAPVMVDNLLLFF